jgi:general secretion pathway protein N
MGLGGALALAAWAPAAWLAEGVASATNGRLQLADAEGSVWHGSALPVLTGGPGTRDAAVLPSRLHWSVTPFWGGLRARLSQSCCLDGAPAIEWRPGWSRSEWALQPQGDSVGRWPAAWLEGLGAPLNTLRLAGELQLRTQTLSLSRERGQTGWQMHGQAQVDLMQASSRLASVEPLGSYQVTLGPQDNGAVPLTLRTLDGALRLSGSGQIGARGLSFRGEAQAGAGFEAALNNLLNIIGRREGALSRISIG